MTAITAYIPCYNNETTIQQSIESIRRQSIQVAELLVVDDASTDNSVAVAEAAGVQVIRNTINEGRGYVRAKAMIAAQNELVLSLDAKLSLPSDFIEKALPWLKEEQVAAVWGRVMHLVHNGIADRWAARHLYAINRKIAASRKSSLLTGGAIVKKSAVINVGNYDTKLRYKEDFDLGERLLANGYDGVFDTNLLITDLTHNTTSGVLERYWRWHDNSDAPMSLLTYIKQCAYAVKVMSAEDIASGDPLCVPISLLSPHYQLWRSKTKKQKQ